MKPRDAGGACRSRYIPKPPCSRCEREPGIVLWEGKPVCAACWRALRADEGGEDKR